MRFSDTRIDGEIDFSTEDQMDFIDEFKDLLQLEYDALEAYNLAIKKLKDPMIIENLESFRNDHQNHINQITAFLESIGEIAPNSPDIKQYLTKGKVALGALIDDKSILIAMNSNELDTNEAYQEILEHGGLMNSARFILERALQDEKKHKKWIEHKLASM